MSFSTEWDQRYQENTHMSIWPWSDMVSFTMKHARPRLKELRVLELGVGAGANIPFFLKAAEAYSAIEGSPAIVARLKETYPQIAPNIACADFTQNIPFEGPFNLIADRGSLTHNSTKAINRCLDMIHGKLENGGLFIGIDWFSTEYSKFHEGHAADDDFTRDGYTHGNMAHVGKVHFSNENHLRELFNGYEFLVLEHKTVKRIVPADGWSFAGWNFVAAKTGRRRAS